LKKNIIDTNSVVKALKSQIEELITGESARTHIMRVASVGLCYLDTDLRYFYINDWLADINGLPAEKHLGRSIRELFPELAASIEPQFQKVIDTGEPIIKGKAFVETPAQPGIKRLFEHSYFANKSADGTVLGISCFVEEITDRARAEEEALKKNIALREILNQIEEERSEYHNQIRLNIDRSIIPSIEKLKERLVDHDLQLMEQIESNLEQIFSPLINRIETQFARLSPRELEIAILIRNGLASKNIASTLNLSIQTIHKFRKFIRHKLGISNKEINLTSFLSTWNMPTHLNKKSNFVKSKRTEMISQSVSNAQ